MTEAVEDHVNQATRRRNWPDRSGKLHAAAAEFLGETFAKVVPLKPSTVDVCELSACDLSVALHRRELRATEVLEAAEVEGASVWRRYRQVILPLMRPTILTNLLLVTILNLSEFTLIYAMTQGGPGIETMTLPLYVYQEAFVFHQLGYGTAISLVLVLIGAVFSLLFVRAARSQA